MDGGFGIDPQEAIDSIAGAEVVSIAFPTFGKALVIDTRRNSNEGPMVRVMPVAGSPQERIRSLRRLRPSLPRVRELTVILWPRFVQSLVTLGIWNRIVDQAAAAGLEDAAATCEAALEELRRLEKAELSAVVTGENYHTVWSAEE